MTIAFVLGNGISRKGIDLTLLKQHGKVYGCNALYREFTPDVLVSTDKPISESIQKSGYSNKNTFYTRRPMVGLGAKILPKQYQGFSSGPNALGLASIDGNKNIFLLGFDLGGNMGLFNNVYADTEFYKKSSDRPTFSGNWVKQIVKICNDFSDIQYHRVISNLSADIIQLNQIKNLKNLDINQFISQINNKKGLV